MSRSRGGRRIPTVPLNHKREVTLVAVLAVVVAAAAVLYAPQLSEVALERGLAAVPAWPVALLALVTLPMLYAAAPVLLGREDAPRAGLGTGRRPTPDQSDEDW